MPVPALTDWPRPKSPLLAGIVDAIRARSKAIKNMVSGFEITIELDSQPESTYERLNLKLDSIRSRPDRLTFVFWDDGAMWVDARRSSKQGWRYEFSFYADCNGIEPDVVRDTIEHSLWIDKINEMKNVWSQFKPYTE